MLKFDREHGVVIRDEEDEFQAIMASERREALNEGQKLGQERGIAIGETRSRNNIIKMLSQNGMSNNEISRYLNIPLEEIEEILNINEPKLNNVLAM